MAFKVKYVLFGYRIWSYVFLLLIPNRLIPYLLAYRVTVEKSGASLTVFFPLQVTYFCLGIGRFLSLSLKFSNFIRMYLCIGVVLYYIFLLMVSHFNLGSGKFLSYLLICFNFQIYFISISFIIAHLHILFSISLFSKCFVVLF